MRPPGSRTACCVGNAGAAENFCLLAALHGNVKRPPSTAHATWSIEIRFNLTRLQLLVRAHKQTRKHVHGFYELHSEKREAAIRGRDHRPRNDGKKARSAPCKNLADKGGPDYAVSSRRRGAEGGSWVKRFKPGISAHIRVALREPSFHGGGAIPRVGVKSGTVGLPPRREFSAEKEPFAVCRARMIGSNA
jgi:hypothetical protein